MRRCGLLRCGLGAVPIRCGPATPDIPPPTPCLSARSIARACPLAVPAARSDWTVGRSLGRSAPRACSAARADGLAPSLAARSLLAARSSLALLLRLSGYSLSSVIPLQTRCTREAGTNMREQSNRGK